MSWGPTRGQAQRSISLEKVHAIRGRWFRGETSVVLADEFGTTKQAVLRIVSGTAYRHVPGWFSKGEREERNRFFRVNG